MSFAQSLVIPVQALQLGTCLGFDLIDSKGLVIQPAGTPIDERLFSHLSKNNIQSLTVRIAAAVKNESESVLRAAYEPSTLDKIQTTIDSARAAMTSLVESIHRHQEQSVAIVKSNVRQFVHEATNDLAATFAALTLNRKRKEIEASEKIAAHSTNLSLLSVAMSVSQKDDPVTSFEIGTAGLLHDCSLYLSPQWYTLKPSARHESHRKKYRRHPVESTDLLNGVPGISRNVLTMVSQLHEQADGTGYPRGLRIERTLPGSLILNLADAYLSLVSPIQGEAKSPADALAYLCFQTTQGKFCRYAYQSLLDGLSMYPVGSGVILDDESEAVVVRANADKPLMPVIRKIHESHIEIDLRESKRSIVGPIKEKNEPEERIKKSQLSEILWRTDR